MDPSVPMIATATTNALGPSESISCSGCYIVSNSLVYHLLVR